MPDMRQSELERLGKCVICGKSQLESPLPIFFVVEITRAGFDLSAVRRAAGLAMQIGGPLASIMGPDEKIATVVDGPYRVFVHETCAGSIPHLVSLIPEAREETPSDV